MTNLVRLEEKVNELDKKLNAVTNRLDEVCKRILEFGKILRGAEVSIEDLKNVSEMLIKDAAETLATTAFLTDLLTEEAMIDVDVMQQYIDVFKQYLLGTYPKLPQLADFAEAEELTPEEEAAQEALRLEAEEALKSKRVFKQDKDPAELAADYGVFIM